MAQSISIDSHNGNLEILATNASPELIVELAALSESVVSGRHSPTYIVRDSRAARRNVQWIVRSFGLTAAA
jgi:hypothetical protein